MIWTKRRNRNIATNDRHNSKIRRERTRRENDVDLTTIVPNWKKEKNVGKKNPALRLRHGLYSLLSELAMRCSQIKLMAGVLSLVTPKPKCNLTNKFIVNLVFWSLDRHVELVGILTRYSIFCCRSTLSVLTRWRHCWIPWRRSCWRRRTPTVVKATRCSPRGCCTAWPTSGQRPHADGDKDVMAARSQGLISIPWPTVRRL